MSFLPIYLSTGLFGLVITLMDLFGTFDDGGNDSDGDDFDSEADVSILAQESKKVTGRIFKILRTLRFLVYFCLGFGIIGTVAYFKYPTTTSLIWAISSGVITIILGSLLKHILRKELDSTTKDSELLMERGEVIVSILPGKLGKVKVKIGNAYLDRYAFGKDRERSYSVKSKVYVIDVLDNNLIIDDIENIKGEV